MNTHEILKWQIEKYAAFMTQESPLFAGASKGKINFEMIQTYLSSIYHILNCTPYFLAKAAKRAEALGESHLVPFFKAKLAEESGHDAWALEDIRQVEVKTNKVASLQPTPAIQSLIQDLEEGIQADPYLYLPYILLTEYFTVLVGPRFIEDLNEYCGITPNMMSVIGKHAELDKEHVQFDLEELALLLSQYSFGSKLVHQMELYMKRFEIFCKEVVLKEKKSDCAPREVEKEARTPEYSV